jgi:hypothetical protein
VGEVGLESRGALERGQWCGSCWLMKTIVAAVAAVAAAERVMVVVAASS